MHQKNHLEDCTSTVSEAAVLDGTGEYICNKFSGNAGLVQRSYLGNHQLRAATSIEIKCKPHMSF